MKKPEDVMEILEAYDLTARSVRRGAWSGVITGRSRNECDEAGGMPAVERARPAMEAVFASKIDELVDGPPGRSGRMSRMGADPLPRP